MNKAVFIDRDGTLIKDVPYNTNISLIEFLPGVIEALSLFKKNNYLLVLITNQSGIAKGFFTVDELTVLHDALQQMLMKHEIKLDGIYYCPHHPDGFIEQYTIECNCRKPKPGLILRAVEDLDIDVSISWMIGDILNDVEAGKSAGCKTILLNNGNETEWIISENRTPDFTLQNWDEIAATIIANENVVLND